MKFPYKINSVTPNIFYMRSCCAPHPSTPAKCSVKREAHFIRGFAVIHISVAHMYAKSHSRRTYRRRTYIYEVQIHLFTSHCVNGWQKINTLHTSIPTLVGPIAGTDSLLREKKKLNEKSIRPEKIAYEKDINDKTNDILILLPPSSSILTFTEHKELCSHDVQRTHRYEFNTAAFAAAVATKLRFPRLKTWNSFIFVSMSQKTE